jgi:ferritin-like metal-binding protein YciE
VQSAWLISRFEFFILDRTGDTAGLLRLQCAPGRCDAPGAVEQEIPMTDPKEHLTHWLRDAYAMESQAVSLLETHISRLKTYPDARAKVQEHLQQTHRQRQDVEDCLAKLGADPSTLKDITQKTIANVQGLFHAMSEDEVLKHALGSYSFEQFEAGSYRMLAAAAREAGEPGIAETCERIQAEEEAMGDWIWQQMPTLTQEYLSRSEVGATAKR